MLLLWGFRHMAVAGGLSTSTNTSDVDCEAKSMVEAITAIGPFWISAAV